MSEPLTEWQKQELWNSIPPRHRARIVAEILNQHLSGAMWDKAIKEWTELDENIKAVVSKKMEEDHAKLSGRDEEEAEPA